MEIRDKLRWGEYRADNHDPYGEAIINYAARWANLMEARMAAGDALEPIAKETSHEADTEGITGAMFGMAVLVLAECWAHGERLRKWHNARYGQPDIDGVVNPAVLIINTEPR